MYFSPSTPFTSTCTIFSSLWTTTLSQFKVETETGGKRCERYMYLVLTAEGPDGAADLLCTAALTHSASPP